MTKHSKLLVPFSINTQKNLRVWYLFIRLEEAHENPQKVSQNSIKRISAEIPNILPPDLQKELNRITQYSVEDALPNESSTRTGITSPQNPDDSQMIGLHHYKAQLKCAHYYLLVADAYRRMKAFEECQKAIKKAHRLVENVVNAVQEINSIRTTNIMLSDSKQQDVEKVGNGSEDQKSGMLFGLVDLTVSNHMQSDVIDSEMVHMLRIVSAGVHYQQGRYYEDGKGFLSEAMAEYETALVDYPNHKESLLQLGVMQYLNKKLMLAKSYLQSAVRVDPNYYEAWYHLGMVVKQMGELEESSECFMASLKLEKTAPYIPYDVVLKRKF
jgi:tetratricopeptide (TPR) repeat protein